MTWRSCAARAALAAALAMTVPCALAADPPSPPGAQATTGGAKKTYDVKLELGQRVPMRDGVVLSTDVYRPDAPGRFPVILRRTPYDNGTATMAKRGRFWARHGFVFVVQDVRGRGDSDGEFRPLAHEALDGYDTQTWCATQPWSNGKVGMTGGSYDGWTQLYPAGLNNPGVAALMPFVAPPDPLKNIPLQDGAYALTMAVWVAYTSGRTLQDYTQQDLDKVMRTLPLTDIGPALGWGLETWREWLEHPALDDYWRPLLYQEKLLETRVPILHVTGWYDDDQVGTTGNFTNLSTRAKDPATRKLQRLLIGPWGHSINYGTKLGEIDFGPTSLVDIDTIQIRWFEHWLAGVDNGVEKEAPVRIFVMGSNVWRDEQEWPLARTRFTRYYLHSDGRANSLFGDGVLSPEPPGPEKPDTFAYDPENPVPFISDPGFQQVGGPDDYRAVERRDDVLVYTTPELQEDLEICGPLRVGLFAASSAKDTDWTAKVLDVRPNGYAQRLNDGIIRARFRKGLDRQVLLEPGQVEEYEIDCWSTCIHLAKGHRVRLEIASSAFPKFDRNLNTGGPIGKESKGIVAQQTVYHDAARPSYLLLPVIPPKVQP